MLREMSNYVRHGILSCRIGVLEGRGRPTTASVWTIRMLAVPPVCPTNHPISGISLHFIAQPVIKPPAGFPRRRPSSMKYNGVSGLAQAIRAIS